MEDASAPVGIESLLRHREWVRRVARALVRDENLADDLEQEVWVDALERPPRRAGSLRAWLATALRNNLVDVRRSEASRRGRENGCSRPEASTPTADLVAEAETHGRLVAAVMALPEPGRSTMLLHYFHGLTLEETARRQGVPLETARTRVRRGLAELRERFDRESGGDRGAWMAALVPLVHGAGWKGGTAGTGVSALKWGGILVQTSTKVAVAAAIVVTGGAVWWALRQETPAGTSAEGAPRGAAPDTGRASARPAFPSLSATDGSSGTARRTTAGTSAGGPGAGPSPAPGGTLPAAGGDAAANRPGTPGEAGRPTGEPPGTAGESGAPAVAGSDGGGGVRGVVYDERGGVVAGLTVRAWRSGEQPVTLETKTGDDGSYGFETLAPGPWTLEAVRATDRIQRIAVNVSDTRSATADFRSGASILGTVQDADGKPLAGILVNARPARPGKGFTSRQSKADDAGSFFLGDLQPGDWLISVLQNVGDRPFAADVATVKVESDPVTVVLRLEAGEIAGRVTLRASGTAVDLLGAQVSLYRLVRDKDGKWGLGGSHAMAFPDGDGRYAFRGLPEGHYRLVVFPKAEGLRKHEQDLDLSAGERKAGVDVALEEMRVGTVRFAVKEPSGKAVEGATFWRKEANSIFTLQARMGEPGIYAATLEAGRKHTVGIDREDLGRAEITVEVREGETVDVEAVLRKPLR